MDYRLIEYYLYISMQPSMLSTQEFIKRKCKKDHFSPSQATQTKPIVKHSSIYTSDFREKKNMKINTLNNENIKQSMSPLKLQYSYLLPLTSVYRNSFEKSQTQFPVKFHQKPSYFLKLQNIQPIQSTYNRSSVLHQSDLNCIKGKPQMDHLFVSKHNKMNTKSLYRQSYLDFTKLPTIHKQNNLIRQSYQDQKIKNQKKI